METYSVPDGSGRTFLIVVAHADDATISCGGLLALLSLAGWRVVLARVTNDSLDSVDMSRDETIKRNTEQLHTAARILGIADIVEFDYETDRLGDLAEVPLREKIIRVYRQQRPYASMTWDPFGVFHENNQDHIKVAEAVDEAFWTSMFDKHHPEHFLDGLEPHALFERWYFARRLLEVTTAVDISASLEVKIDAVTAHDTMMRNYMHQLRLQAATGGRTIPLLEAAREGDLRPLIAAQIRRTAQEVGARYGLPLAEEYRRVSFDTQLRALDPSDALP